jgi:hypothetical protein
MTCEYCHKPETRDMSIRHALERIKVCPEPLCDEHAESAIAYCESLRGHFRGDE